MQRVGLSSGVWLLAARFPAGRALGQAASSSVAFGRYVGQADPAGVEWFTTLGSQLLSMVLTTVRRYVEKKNKK